MLFSSLKSKFAKESNRQDDFDDGLSTEQQRVRFASTFCSSAQLMMRSFNESLITVFMCYLGSLLNKTTFLMKINDPIDLFSDTSSE